MLDTSNLSAFCKGIADALRKKKGTTEEIQYKKFDEEIESIDTNKGLVEMLESKTTYNYALATAQITEVPIFTPNATATDYTSFLIRTPILKFPNSIDFSNARSAGSFCYDCTNMSGDVVVDFSKVLNLSVVFGHCKKLKNIKFLNGTLATTNFSRAIISCMNLESVKGLDFSNITTAAGIDNAFSNCVSLQTIEFFKDECVKVSLSLGNSPLLTEQSKTNIINALATVTTSPTLTLNSKVTLTDEQIETINSKGWNLAYVN